MKPIDIKNKGKGAIREKFEFKHLFRKHLKVHAKYLTASPVNVFGLSQMFPVNDQNGSGSCGGQSWSFYLQVLKYLRDNVVVRLSAKDLYSHCFIAPEGSTEGDLLNWVENYGIDTEANVPSYSGTPPTIPPSEEFMEQIQQRNEDEALQNLVQQAYTFNGNDINQVKQAIDLGHGAVCALEGNNACWSSGDIEVPDTLDWGHWIYLIDYDDTTKKVRFINSWGDGWGYSDYGYIPYEYFSNWRVYGEWVLVLAPQGYYIGLLGQIKNLLQQLIDHYIHKI